MWANFTTQKERSLKHCFFLEIYCCKHFQIIVFEKQAKKEQQVIALFTCCSAVQWPKKSQNHSHIWQKWTMTTNNSSWKNKSSASFRNVFPVDHVQTQCSWGELMSNCQLMKQNWKREINIRKAKWVQTKVVFWMWMDLPRNLASCQRD